MFHRLILRLSHPRMLHDLGCGGPFVRIEIQDQCDEVFEIFGECWFEFICPSGDGSLNFFDVIADKGGILVCELVEEYAQGPDIDLVVVFLLGDHFWGHILVGAAEGPPLHVDISGGPAEVAELCIVVLIEKNVLRLHIF